MAFPARVVCWQNREEWLYVYRALYSLDDPEAQRKGVDRVAAWKSRSAGKLPLAIECTANLISAQLAMHNAGFDVQERLTLAMAIVRFVNGMADQVQKGKFARSVQSIADEIGLPDWLVDLRHEATHASLPSMETLQCGLRASLSWLQSEYWEAQINVHQENVERLSQLLKEYRDVTLSHATSRKKIKKLKSSSKMKEISEEIVNVVSISNLWSLLPSILSHEDMLVPSHDQLNALDVKWPVEISSTDSSTSNVPAAIINMWKTLLEALDKSSSEFTTSLIIHLLENLSDVHANQTEDISLGFAAWIKCLLKAQSTKQPSLVLTSDIPWVTLLQVVLEKPSVYSLTFIPLILESMPLISASVKEKIQHLVSVFVNLECDNSDHTEESQCFDLEGLVVNRRNTSEELHSREHREGDSSANLGWQVSQGASQWQLIPFGEPLGTTDLSPTNLELPQPLENLTYTGSDTEHLGETGNSEITAANDEALISDPDNSDSMSVDQYSDQPCHNMLDSEAVLQTQGDQEHAKLSCPEAAEGANDITSLISTQIYLF